MLRQLEGYCLRLGNREQEAELAVAIRRYSTRDTIGLPMVSSPKPRGRVILARLQNDLLY
jgi:hypothetical protein